MEGSSEEQAPESRLEQALAQHRRVLQLLATLVASVALALMATSFHRGIEARSPTRRTSTQLRSDLPLAPTYAQEQARHHPNRLRHEASLNTLSQQRPARTDPVTLSEPEKLAALAARAERRAYDGAPPTVPHPIAQQDFPACLNCHASGLRVASRTAPAMCHDEHSNCAQCHVVSERPMPGSLLPPSVSMDNSFQGLATPTTGTRAWPGAPPTVPHNTSMRSRCESCHGVLGTGIRSSHPWRENCLQCHATDATLERRIATLPIP